MLSIIYGLCKLINKVLAWLLCLGAGLAIFGVISWGQVGYVALAILAILVVGIIVGKIATQGMNRQMRALWMKGLI